MDKPNFISRNEDGQLEIKNREWATFKNNLLSMASNQRELEFIGQLVEDLHLEYDERLDEYEELD